MDRACACLRRIAALCGCRYTELLELLRSTEQVIEATKCQEDFTELQNGHVVPHNWHKQCSIYDKMKAKTE